MKPTGEALKDNETDTINVCSCRQQRRCHRTGRCPHWPFRGRHLKRRLIWSFTDSLEQDTCSNYQKVRYVCKCVLRKTILCKPPFCHSPDPTFTWGRIGTSTSKNHKYDTCMAKADGSRHQPQRIINVTPAGPRGTDRDINLEES